MFYRKIKNKGVIFYVLISRLMKDFISLSQKANPKEEQIDRDFLRETQMSFVNIMQKINPKRIHSLSPRSWPPNLQVVLI